MVRRIRTPAAVCRTVSGNHVRLAGDARLAVPPVADAPRDGVVRLYRHAVAAAPLHRHQQPVVLRRAVVNDLLDAGVELAFRGVLQIQHATGLCVARRCAWTIHCRIDLVRHPEVLRHAADVVRRHHPAGCDLPLVADVPLIDGRRLQVERVRRVVARLREHPVTGEQPRNGIAARRRGPRVVPALWKAVQRNRIPPGRILREARIGL